MITTTDISEFDEFRRIETIVKNSIIESYKLNSIEELRIKETDRINAIYQNLKNMQAKVKELKTGLSITGGEKLHSSNIDHFGDHRIAMSFEILNFLISGKHSGQFQEIIDISFPRFYEYIDFLNKWNNFMS